MAEILCETKYYSPGATGGTTVRPFDGGDNNVSILGGANNEVLLNGSPNTYKESTFAANTISPPPDAVGEVKIFTNIVDAELDSNELLRSLVYRYFLRAMLGLALAACAYVH